MLKENKLNDKSKTVKQTAFAFVVLMGIVSMCSDMTHESASSIMGAYLSLAGASAAAIGFVSGLGELMGYSLRLVTGIFTDRTKGQSKMSGGIIREAVVGVIMLRLRKLFNKL